MALVSYILIPSEIEGKYWVNLKPTDRFVFSRVTKNTRFLSRQKKLSLAGRSLFSWFAEYWKELTPEEKQNWKEAAAEMEKSGWQLFVHDTAARWKFEIPWFAEPDLLHQGWIGWCHIEEPSDEIKITQLHPKFYWVRQKVKGTKSLYEPVKVTEDVALPIKIQLNYFSDLVQVAENPFAKLYAEVWHSYQGYDFKTELKIDLDFQTGWRQAEATLTTLAGYVIHYDLYFHLKGLRGDLYFDNIKSEHSAQNWVRDPFCNEIEKVYPRVWFLIPKNWVGVVVPAGAHYESTYRDF